MIVPDISTLKGTQFTEKHFRFHYPEFLKFLNDKYKGMDLSFQEKLYWYFNNLTERPVCKCCSKETKFENANKGYRTYCSYKCLNSDSEKKKKVEETCINKFGTKAPAQSRIVQYKMEQTNLKKYGSKNAMQNKDIAKKSKDELIRRYGGCGNASKELKEKYKNTSIERYGAENYASTKECRDKMSQTNIERYGVSSYSKTDKFKKEIIKLQPIIRKKVYNTKKQNNTFNTSQIEADFANWLTENNINFIRQHHDDKYPFNCDFYFHDKDLYLEIQGSWTHGGHPYDPNSKDDQEYLLEMQSKNTDYYNNAIEVWTVRDPLKRETAKKNKLNWVEVFSTNLDDVIEIFKNNT